MFFRLQSQFETIINVSEIIEFAKSDDTDLTELPTYPWYIYFKVRGDSKDSEYRQEGYKTEQARNADFEKLWSALNDYNDNFIDILKRR